MTKADVLDAFSDLSVCTSYKTNGKEDAQVPFQMTWNKIEPVYQSFKGWNTDTTGIKDANALPQEMKNYVAFLNEKLGVPITYISNGPGRDQLIKVNG